MPKYRRNNEFTRSRLAIVGLKHLHKQPMTADELAKQMNVSRMSAFRICKYLYERKLIDVYRYRLLGNVKQRLWASVEYLQEQSLPVGLKYHRKPRAKCCSDFRKRHAIRKNPWLSLVG